MARTLVRGFLGQPGSGKTYAMSTMAGEWCRRNQGKRIFSTYELRLPNVYSLDPPGDTWGPLADLETISDGLLLIDEAALLFDSRKAMGIPLSLLQKLMQVRKHKLECWWSTQHLEYVDKRLRLLTTESYHCGSLAGVPIPGMGGFFITIRYGLKGASCGMRYLRRSKKRDGLYDSWATVKVADYLAGRRERRAPRQSDAEPA